MTKTLLLLTVTFFSLPLAQTPAQAGCVHSDINAQYAITGRNSPPPTQQNNVDVLFGSNCLGNSSHGRNTQIGLDTVPIVQDRSRTSILTSPKSDLSNYLPNTPNVSAEIEQQLHFPVLPDDNLKYQKR